MVQFIHTKYKNRSNNTPTGIFSKISRLRSMFLFFSVILASMISKVRSMIFGRTFIALPRYAFLILAFLAMMSVFGFSASVFADSSSSAVYGDEGSVENSSNFSVTVEELNALELRLSASDLVLDLNPTSDAPVFGSSDLSVTVYTTNTTGYYLTMTPTYQSVATTNLTRTESLSGSYPTIATLSSTASPSTFASTSDTTTSNKWGYKVNTTNLATVDTTIYNPTIAASIPLNKTNTPINTGDETDITFAAKVDSETPAGSYKVDLNFTAITNANTYSITFNPGSASSDASLTNMPSPNPQTGALESGSSTSITLSSSTPTRNGYSFLGWCSVAPTTSNNADSCSGTTYQPNSSITIYTDTPDITLYAIWSLNSYACTKQYRLQNADGTWGNYITDTTEQVAYGSTCSYTKSVTNYTGVSGINSQSASTSGTMGTSGLTLQLDFYRNTYTINVTNSNTTSGASSLTIRYGGSATVTVTPSSGYYLSGVSCPSGYTCSGYNTGTSYTSAQTITITNNGTTSGGTLSFTGTVSGYSYNLTFNGNGGTPSSTSLSGTGTIITLPTATYHAASTTNTSTRYATLAGWSETPNASSATYTGSMTISSATTKTLYAVWSFNSGTLQNTSTSCGSNMIDARTGVSYLTYTISNQCYMEQNLYLPTGFTLYAGDSNIYSTAASKNQQVSWATPTASLTAGTSYTEARMVAGTYTNNTYNVTGGWYNYCAASAGTVCDSTTTENANSDICPKGWRLPTNSEMGNVASASRDYWKFGAGYYGGGYLQGASSDSYWWSATANGATRQYSLRYYNGSLNTNGTGNYFGFFVRCVRS
ncbi:InlB B-repeat-containing protein [Candidatus Saccharibacteria bacterium]|nr:InlB B-repeat-containing protein [Candidatus Saccharibacteria bacterium]MBQ3263848.1 InlB B-repeat-containing protein [Candidatus Saccharibacteria bacterium]